MASRIIQLKIQEYTRGYILDHINHKLEFDFEDLLDHVNRSFPRVDHNWLVTVRSPIQQFINEKKIKRDMADIRSAERYLII